MGVPALSCSNLPPTTSAGSNVTEAFGAQRRVEPKGPLVSSEGSHNGFGEAEGLGRRGKEGCWGQAAGEQGGCG